MNCHRCGQPLATNAISCGYCARINQKTRVFVDPASRKTQMLVAVETCANCGFLVYPGDNECAACGTGIQRAWQQTKSPLRRGSASRKTVALGVTFSLIALVAVVLLLHYMVGI